MRMGWVLGWAIPRYWFASWVEPVFPLDTHLYFDAGPKTRTELVRAGHVDYLIGYSLGSQILLQQRSNLTADRITLLTPIFGFPKEMKLGGRVSRTQVQYLARWIQTDLEAALADFSRRAGLGLSPPIHSSIEDLLWGLALLATARIPPPLPKGWQAYCGEHDSLLDASALRRLAPTLAVVPDATHHPSALLRAFRASL